MSNLGYAIFPLLYHSTTESGVDSTQDRDVHWNVKEAVKGDMIGI